MGCFYLKGHCKQWEMPSRDDAILAERRQKTKGSHGVRINQTDLFISGLGH